MTAVSNSFYQTLVCAGAPLGVLGPTARTLRSANGTRIGVLGCTVLYCSVRITGGRPMPSSGLLEGPTLFTENTGLIVGRTLVDPSRWKVLVLVSNFSPDTVVVAPFSEVGMLAQVSAIQSITEPLHRPQGDADSLPAHLRGLLD